MELKITYERQTKLQQTASAMLDTLVAHAKINHYSSHELSYAVAKFAAAIAEPAKREMFFKMMRAELDLMDPPEARQ